MSHYLAFDLGAESGRAMLGTLDGGRLEIEELHRFANTPVRVFDALYWDTLRLWHEIQRGLAIAGRERRLRIDGIGIDTWGVDFALLGADGALADNPRHYRDARTSGVMQKVFDIVPRAEVFAQTGIQFMPINSLYQFYALKLAGSPALEAARTLLFMPDLLNYWLASCPRLWRRGRGWVRCSIRWRMRRAWAPCRSTRRGATIRRQRWPRCLRMARTGATSARARGR